MEEKKTKKIVRKDAENKEAAAPAKSGSTVGLRIGSVVLWAVAIACEVLCILLLNGTFYVPISMMAALIIGIVIDLVCVVVAAMLWKKANRIKPMKKEGNKVGFYLWSQLGLIMAIACFRKASLKARYTGLPLAKSITPMMTARRSPIPIRSMPAALRTPSRQAAPRSAPSALAMTASRAS